MNLIQSDHPPSRHTSGWTILAIVLVGIAGIAIGSMKAIIIGAYVTDFHVSAPVAGYLLSTEMTAATLGTLLATIMRPRWALMAALIALSVGDVGTALAPQHGWLFAWQVLAGLGHGYALGRFAASVAATSNPQRVTGLYTASYLILSSLTAMRLPDLKGLLGGHALFLMIALTGPLALGGLRWFPQGGRAHAIDRNAGPGAGPLLTVVVCATLLIWYLSIGGYWPFLGQMGALAGVSADDRARILGSANLFGLLGASLSVIVGGRFGSARPLAAFIGLQLAAMILFMVRKDPTSFTVSAWLYVFAWLGGFPFLLGLLSRLDPTGRLNALLNVMGNAAYALSPAAAGLMIRLAQTESVGLQRLATAGLVLLLASGATLVALAVRQGRPLSPAPTV